MAPILERLGVDAKTQCSVVCDLPRNAKSAYFASIVGAVLAAIRGPRVPGMVFPGITTHHVHPRTGYGRINSLSHSVSRKPYRQKNPNTIPRRSHACQTTRSCSVDKSPRLLDVRGISLFWLSQKENFH